jgi:hypothetical protein
MPTAVAAVEGFHIAFLRALEVKLDRARYVVKGGVNLRGWFGSARYSEDLDLDALGIESYVLRETVDGVLASTPLKTLLRARGLAVIRSSKPKQTETTQRWKLELAAPPLGVALHTKIEFSHRPSDEAYELAPMLAAIVRRHGIPAPTANHYLAPAAARQKIRALAGRKVPQARDIWDLDHLFRAASADLRPLPPDLGALLPVALERVLEMPYDVFESQVVPFLDAETQDLYRDPMAWDRMREHVVDRLSDLSP